MWLPLCGLWSAFQLRYSVFVLFQSSLILRWFLPVSYKWSAISYIYTDWIICFQVLWLPLCYTQRKLIKSLCIIWFNLPVEMWLLVVVQDVNSSLKGSSCCYEQALYAFGIACAQWYTFYDIVTVHVNKEAVIVFIPFYFCNKNVILFSHNWNKVV